MYVVESRYDDNPCLLYCISDSVYLHCWQVSTTTIEQWIGSLLPSRQFGFIVLTTSAGIMDHEEAKRRGIGGKLLGYFY